MIRSGVFTTSLQLIVHVPMARSSVTTPTSASTLETYVTALTTVETTVMRILSSVVS